MGWIGYITSIGNIKSCYKILVENLKGKHKSGDQAVDGTILLNTVFNKELECNSMESMQLDQGVDQWWANVDTEMKPEAPRFLTSLVTWN
jgi:hypothetical protein